MLKTDLLNTIKHGQCYMEEKHQLILTVMLTLKLEIKLNDQFSELHVCTRQEK
jgi:hypothetical protein